MKARSRSTILILFLFIVCLMVVLTCFCSLSLYQFTAAVIKNDRMAFSKSYPNAGFCIDWFTPFENIAGALRQKKYLVLLQNNYELRASGGFMGSYAVLNFGDYGLENWRVENIYVPDGQIKGHVAPIIPIQQSFRTGDWKLHDSNWEVDFSQAASDIEWFFAKGGEENIDGLIAINFSLVEKLMKILGNVYLADYGQSVDAKSVYTLTQTYSEQGSFAGSTQKQSFLSSFGKSLWENILNSPPLTKVKVANLLSNELKKRQILLSVKDKNIAQIIKQKAFDGSLGSYNYDYFYPVESNLGANKANCCITRNIIHAVNSTDNIIISKYKITLQNNSQSAVPNPPDFWGGDYRNYQRIVIPKSAENITVTVNSKKYLADNSQKDILNLPDPEDDFTYLVDDYKNFKIIGFWVLTPAKTASQTLLSYELPLKPDQNKYEVKVKIQPGIYQLPYQLIVNNKTVAVKTLTKTEIFKKNFKQNLFNFF